MERGNVQIKGLQTGKGRVKRRKGVKAQRRKSAEAKRC